jgi:hypothetical protein
MSEIDMNIGRKTDLLRPTGKMGKNEMSPDAIALGTVPLPIETLR